MAQYTIISKQIENKNIENNKQEILNILKINHYSISETVELFDEILKQLSEASIT